MRVKIKSIEAELIDASNLSEDIFLISRWVVKYDVFVDLNETHLDMSGTVTYKKDLPETHVIIQQIKEFYGNQRTEKQT